jgi:succinate-acetate transporter protein
MPGDSRSSSIYVQEYKPSDKQDRERRSGDLKTTTIRRHYPPPPKLANPTPLGLSAFALSVMVISFYNCGAFGVGVPNVAVGVSLFTGGVVQVNCKYKNL